MFKIVLLAGDGYSSRVVANALLKKGLAVSIIVETKRPARSSLKRRFRRVGWTTGIGQVLFALFCVIASRSKRRRLRIKEILEGNGLIDQAPAAETIRVDDINDAQVIDSIRKFDPSLIIVNGTSILSKRTLSSLSCAVVNTHLGITPMYRGVHGGYWALANGDLDNFGSTVHLVDVGVDTGAIAGQIRLRPSVEDDFFTFPALQLAAAVPILLQVVDDSMNCRLVTRQPVGVSRQWYHPTLWGYLYFGFTKGVW